MRSLSGLLVALVALAAAADTFDDAGAAAERGDYERAFALLLPLAEAGDPIAQYNIGALYDAGHVVPSDARPTKDWYRMAAEQGYAPAQFNLAARYYEGRGVAQDYVRASVWNSVAIGTASSEYVDTYRRFHEALLALMTPEQIGVAEALARQCVERQFKGCD